MTDENSQMIVNQILTTLPKLVRDTIEDYQRNPDVVDLQIQIQWQVIILIIKNSESLLTEHDHLRLADELECSLLQIEEAMTEIDETARRSIPPLEEWSQIQDVDANPKPVASLWTEDELKQFTTKGA